MLTSELIYEDAAAEVHQTVVGPFENNVYIVRCRQSGEAVLIDAARQRLAAFKAPKRIFFVDDLPRNAMGKVQKNLLRERYKTTFV